ncbi:MAG TPA: hypothetical protein VIO36_01835 [Anaerolineaceae bacterium]
MDKIRDQIKNPVVIAVLGGIVGLILGLVIGWGIWPVQWYDAAVTDLRQDLQQDYLRMTIDSFAKNNNLAQAQERWQALGDNREEILSDVQIDPRSVTPGDIAKFTAQVAGSVAAPTVNGTQPAGAETVPTEAPATGQRSSLLTIALVVLCVAMLVIAGALAYMFIFRKGRGGLSLAGQAHQASRQAVKTDYTALGEQAPVIQFTTTYLAGDELYDDSFSIDAPTGEFLGECGVGISETVGVGEPKKVTAFEVWLFDKNDIQTVTKVLMSGYAFNDATIRQRLESKGEPVLIMPGDAPIELETATLVLRAKVMEMGYGSGPLPPESYFDRLTLELSIWQKQLQA